MVFTFHKNVKFIQPFSGLVFMKLYVL